MQKHLWIKISAFFIILTLSLTPAIRAEEYDPQGLLIIAPGAHQDLIDMEKSDYNACMNKYSQQLKDHIDLIEANPDAAFNMGNTFNVQHFLNTFPKYRPRLKALMKKDRISSPALWVDWEPEWYTGEYLVRSIAYAKYWLMRELDYEPRWMHINDLPSIIPQLAQILKKSDVDLLLFNDNRLPHMPLFGYYGAPDGSRVFSVGNEYMALLDFTSIDKRMLNPYLNNMQPFGVRLAQAAHDEGIDRAHTYTILKTCRAWKSKYPGGPVIRLGTVQEFTRLAMQAIRDKDIKLPETTGVRFGWPWASAPFLFESARWHALAESMLPVVEELSSICELLGLEKYPEAEVDKAWELILWSMDHNWGPSSGLKDAKEESNHEAYNLTLKMLHKKFNRLASEIKPAQPGRQVVIFNPLNWERTEPVSLDLPAEEAGFAVSVTDAAGRSIPAQISDVRKGQPGRLTFIAEDIPPVGYKCYYLTRKAVANPAMDEIKTGADFIENKYYRIKADKHRGISSIYDKQHKRELLDQNSAYQFGWAQTERDRKLPPFLSIQGFKATAQGPLQASLEVEAVLGNSRPHTKVTLTKDSRVIDLRFDGWPVGLDYGGVKYASIVFPFNLDSYNLQFGLAYGCIPDLPIEFKGAKKIFRRLPERLFSYNDGWQSHQPERWSMVAQKWFAQGDSTYTIDVALDNIQARTYIAQKDGKKIPFVHVIGSPKTGRKNNIDYDFHFTLKGHPGDWQTAHSHRMGWETSVPLLVTVVNNPKGGKLPEEAGFLTLKETPKGQNIVLSAFKKAFDGNGYVIRFFGAEDIDTTVAVTVNPLLNMPKAEVSRVNMVEKAFQVLDPAATKHDIPVLGFGVESLRFFQTPVTDITPPAKVGNLAAIDPTSVSVELTWSATGDNGLSGRAAAYDIRYAAHPITPENWGQATQIKGPAPKDPQAKESFIAGGLSPNTKYYFAMKVLDEAGNASPISNPASATTMPPDTTPPATVKDLKILGSASTAATLTWTAPGDDGMAGRATSYELHYSVTPLDATTLMLADKADSVPAPAQGGKAEKFLLTGLEPGTGYYIALRAIDEAGNESLSNIVRYTTGQVKSLTIQQGRSPNSEYKGVQDAYVSNINEDEQAMFYGQGSVMSTWPKRGRLGLIKFDLSALPPGSRIYRAELKLYAMDITYADAGQVRCYRAIQNWKEKEVNWQQAMQGVPWKDSPAAFDSVTNYGLGDNGLLSRAGIKDKGAWAVLDVTKTVQEWANGKYPNFGWVIQGSCADECGIIFCTSEHKSRELRPVLEIKYD